MNQTKRCAILTIQDLSGYYVYDPLFYPALHELGWKIDEVPWDQADVDWGQYQAVVIRSTWDYQHRLEEFLQVLEQIDSHGVQLFNPLAVVRWNSNKSYLQDLARKGVPVLPTGWLDRLDGAQIRSWLADFQTDCVVVKPLVGANSEDTFVLTSGREEDWQTAINCFADKPLMIQPYVPSIETTGEFSLFYFGGKYSHAVLKQPKQGDFRVQEEHGGQIGPHQPSPILREVAEQVLAKIGETLLFARVDLVDWQGSPHLMELELIEPSLYLVYDADSPQRFADALDRMAAPPVAMPSRKRTL